MASTGGHLTELYRIVRRLDLTDAHWITFDTPQSRGLLKAEETTFVPYVKPRDWRGVLRAAWSTRKLRREYDGVISTGAGLALAVLPGMVLHRKPAVFIESISRVHGPSLSGRILRHVPRVGVLTPHAWARRPWTAGPSILRDYGLAGRAPHRSPVRRIYVTLGTIRPYRFDRLIDLVADYARRHPVDVRWQLGSTTRDDLPGDVHDVMSLDEFSESIQWADVVVAHAGVGVALNILDSGRVPVLLPRSGELDEHIDEHQQEIFDHLVVQGVAADAEVALSDPAALNAVAEQRVVRVPPTIPDAQEDRHPGRRQGR